MNEALRLQVLMLVCINKAMLRVSHDIMDGAQWLKFTEEKLKL